MRIPIGTIMAYGGKTSGSDDGKLNEDGWLVCQGQEVSRTTYKELYKVIGDYFGSGDKGATFNVPDFRGRFLRGVDHGKGNDPDGHKRESSATGGAKGDHVGSYQEDAMVSHSHGLHKWDRSFEGEDGDAWPYVDVSTERTYSGSTESAGNGTENRPKNVYVNWLIYAGEVKN